jgi:predicted nucleic acid-binding protein
VKKPDAVVVDTGPLIAIIDEDDADHSQCWKALNLISPRTKLVTVLPVLTEAFYMLSDIFGATDKLFNLLETLKVELIDVRQSDLARGQELMRQYKDLPMDFADATIVVAAENLGATKILTLDHKDFSIYRPKHIKHFTLLP